MKILDTYDFLKLLFREEDISETMYQSMYSGNTTRPALPWSNGQKIDSVCDLLLNKMLTNKEKYILPIISCLVKSSKSKVDNALLEIKSLKGTIIL